MSDRRVVRNAATGEKVLARVKWCRSFWCHFRGLMLRRGLAEDDGLLFVYGRPSVSQTSIHMFFVFFAIAAVWMDADGTVITASLARPWRPYYAAARPAQYMIEARPSLLERVKVGDRLVFDERAPR